MDTIRGYVLEDESGLLVIVPFFCQDPHAAVEYVRKNRVIETLTKEPHEDEINFKIRLLRRLEYRKSQLN